MHRFVLSNRISAKVKDIMNKLRICYSCTWVIRVAFMIAKKKKSILCLSISRIIFQEWSVVLVVFILMHKYHNNDGRNVNVFDQSKMTMTDLPNSSSMVLPPAVSLTPSTLLNKMEKALPHTPGTGASYVELVYRYLSRFCSVADL